MKLVGKYCFDVLAVLIAWSDYLRVCVCVCVCVYVCVYVCVFIFINLVHIFIYYLYSIYVTVMDCNDLFSYLPMYSMFQYWDFV
jgi:hypothetical protein